MERAPVGSVTLDPETYASLRRQAAAGWQNMSAAGAQAWQGAGQFYGGARAGLTSYYAQPEPTFPLVSAGLTAGLYLIAHTDFISKSSWVTEYPVIRPLFFMALGLWIRRKGAADPARGIPARGNLREQGSFIFAAGIVLFVQWALQAWKDREAANKSAKPAQTPAALPQKTPPQTAGLDGGRQWLELPDGSFVRMTAANMTPETGMMDAGLRHAQTLYSNAA